MDSLKINDNIVIYIPPENDNNNYEFLIDPLINEYFYYRLMSQCILVAASMAGCEQYCKSISNPDIQELSTVHPRLFEPQLSERKIFS